MDSRVLEELVASITLKMVATLSFITLVHVYKSTCHYNAQFTAIRTTS